MKSLRNDTKTRPSVEQAFPIRDGRDLRSKAEAVKWEDRLTDWEWIALWATIYSVELASLSEQTSIKH